MSPRCSFLRRRPASHISQHRQQQLHVHLEEYELDDGREVVAEAEHVSFRTHPKHGFQVGQQAFLVHLHLLEQNELLQAQRHRLEIPDDGVVGDDRILFLLLAEVGHIVWKIDFISRKFELGQELGTHVHIFSLQIPCPMMVKQKFAQVRKLGERLEANTRYYFTQSRYDQNPEKHQCKISRVY